MYQLLKLPVEKLRKWSVTNPVEYNSDTPQPDMLDVVLFLGTCVVLVYELLFKLGENRHARELLAVIAATDWADDGSSFKEQVEPPILPTPPHAFGRVSSPMFSKTVLTFAYRIDGALHFPRS